MEYEDSLTKKVNTHLYTLNQADLRSYILFQLKAKKIPYTLYDGNVYSIRFNNRPLFVAHLDTVKDEDTKVGLMYAKGILTRNEPAVLGADDRAGVNIILDHIESVNFCFTRDEETGCQGAKSLKKHQPFTSRIKKLPCAIELDRRNGTDIIEYCSEDLSNDIIRYCPPMKVARGLTTDVAQWDDIIPAVNLSVGYYNPHMNSEYLDVQQYEIVYDMIPRLNRLKADYKLKPKPVYTYRGYDNYADDEYDDYYGNYYPSKKKVYHICQTCGVSSKFFPTRAFYRMKNKQIVCAPCLAKRAGCTRIV